MNKDIANQIAGGDDELAARLGAAILSLVDACQDAQTRTELLQRGEPVSLDRVALAPEELAALREMGVLADDETGSVRANVMVQIDPHRVLSDPPVLAQRVVLITDWPDIAPTEPHPLGLFDPLDMVFPLHYESLAVIQRLAELPQAVRQASALDLFCGSGVLGVYASLFGARSVLFADNVPRALAFARVNAYMNAVASPAFTVDDVFEGISPDERFDLILANPPFEAVSDEDRGRYFRHSFGGRDGQEFMERFLREVLAWLTPQGIAIAVDFLISKSRNSETQEQFRRDATRLFDLHTVSVEYMVLDRIPLQDFWIRFDALGLDVNHLLRDSYEHVAMEHLLLATLEIRKANPEAGFAYRYAERPPPVPWWNPLGWPLPTGIRRDPSTVRTWLFAWADHEAEKRGEFGALQAERFVSNSNRVVPWDFSSIPTDANAAMDPTSQAIVNALVRLANDARDLSLINAIVPTGAEIVLLAGSDDLSSRCLGVRASWGFSTLRGPQGPDAEPLIRQIPCADLPRRWAVAAEDPARLLFFFTIKDPAPADNGGAPRHFADLGYEAIAEGCLVYRGESFRAGRDGCPPVPNAVQHFVLDLRLPAGAPEILGNFDALVRNSTKNPSWRSLVFDQCFRFLRDRLTLLAIPMIMVRNREEELRSTARSRLFAFIRHSLDNTITKEIADDTAAAVVRRHLYLDRLMLRAAEVAGEAPRPEETKWRCSDFGNEPLGRTVETVFRRDDPRDRFALTIDDAAILEASVDPRFAAIVVELARNLFKRRDYDPAPTMRFHRGSRGGITITVEAKALPSHGRSIVGRLHHATSELLNRNRSSELRSIGLGFVAQLATEISSKDRYAAQWALAYVGDDGEYETVREEDPFGRWAVSVPRPLLRKGERDETIPVSLRITITDCVAQQ